MAGHQLFLHVPIDSWLSVPEASLANEALLRVTAQIREIRGGKVCPANSFWGAAGSGGWPLSGPRGLSVQDLPCPWAPTSRQPRIREACPQCLWSPSPFLLANVVALVQTFPFPRVSEIASSPGSLAPSGARKTLENPEVSLQPSTSPPANTRESAPRGPRPRDPARPDHAPEMQPRPGHAPGMPPRPDHAPPRQRLPGSSRGCAPATFPGFAALSPRSTPSRDVPYGPGRPLSSLPGPFAPTMRPRPRPQPLPGRAWACRPCSSSRPSGFGAPYPVKGRRPAGLRAQGLPAPSPAAWPPGGPQATAAALKMPHILHRLHVALWNKAG